jgi:DNA polymerase I-like protein with 3'-5' exonuclease and polymerase domains
MLAIYRGEMRNKDGSLIDIHTNMVRRIYGDVEETSGIRTACKAINFGYWMGQTYVGLKLELQKAGLDVSDDDAQKMIAEANALYKGAQTYKDAMIAEAERNGYIRCPLSGRIRYVGGIRSKDDRVRAEAQRFAYSTPIQESAQALAKKMLADAWHEVYTPRRRRGEHVEPLLWTHDDLLSEVEIPKVLEVAKELKVIMTRQPVGFSVPLSTTPEAGLNWNDLVPLE